MEFIGKQKFLKLKAQTMDGAFLTWVSSSRLFAENELQ